MIQSDKVFNEVAIATLKDFQIAIPSRIQTIPRKIFSTWVPLPKRIYNTKGGVIWNRRLLFRLSCLRIENLFPKSSPFPELKRLAGGIPISFEVKSKMPLPIDIRKQAIFTCQMSDKKGLYYSVFRDVVPQSVKIFPCQGIMDSSDDIDFISIFK